MYSEWDGLSGCKKGHMTWPSTYNMFSGYPYDKPRFNNKASVRAEAYKVPCSDRRFSYELAASRYLILVVPGAKLGSVSLASVWKCSVYTFLPSRNIS